MPEERRTRALVSRRGWTPLSTANPGRLDAEAIAQVRRQMWPEAESADELHEALLRLLHRAERDRVARPAPS